jgi:cellulose synthase/poly-beta-1,6-N-acetylglucosamine synthase-like glycosyltransferase
MIAVLEAILIVGNLVLAVPVSVIFLQALAAWPRHRVSAMPDGPRPSIAVLIPAHNEQHVIGKTLTSIAAQLGPRDRLVVIADNCSDDTADIARQQGAEITVRNDPGRRGKGYALDHGLHFLKETGIPSVVICVDADCQVRERCIDRLARISFQSRRPVQAAYLMIPPYPARKATAMVSFAWTVKDFVRPLGWHRLGLPCQLAGSGMAFPWDVARATSLASDHLAEDLKQGLDLALLGIFPLFCPDAVVTSEVAVGGEPSPSQRARWEHGTMGTALEYLPRLLLRVLRAPSLPLLAVMLDLSVLPLAFLALALGIDAALTLCFLFISGVAAPAAIAGMLAVFFLAAICLAWWRHGQALIPLRWLVFAPVYAFLKIPLYGRFFLDRQRAWVRGERRAG